MLYSIPYDTITYNMSHNMSYITPNFTHWPPLCPSGCCCAGAHSNHPHAPPCDAWWSLLLVAWPQTHAPSSWPQPQPCHGDLIIIIYFISSNILISISKSWYIHSLIVCCWNICTMKRSVADCEDSGSICVEVFSTTTTVAVAMWNLVVVP